MTSADNTNQSNSPSPSCFDISPIGFVQTPFMDKFGIPRQASLFERFNAHLNFIPPFDNPDAFRGLEEFSHIWLTFLFHQHRIDESESGGPETFSWKPLIRPPRLGGNKKIGVFASRSSFRPNGIGQSLVKLIGIDHASEELKLTISCPDILNGTPIIDIKPYIHYSDSVNDSHCAWANSEPEAPLEISFSDSASRTLENLNKPYENPIKELIISCIENDPRPAYKQKKQDNKTYHLRIYDLEVSFEVNEEKAKISQINQINE